VTQPIQVPQRQLVEGAASKDPVLDYMIQMGMPISIQSYLEFNYPDGVPDDITLADVLPNELYETLPPTLATDDAALANALLSSAAQ